jgi:hypothetical protein
MMKNNIAFTVLLLCFALPVQAAQNTAQLLKAMRDEITRSMEQLSVDKLQKPYYVEYTLTLRSTQSVKSTLGGLISKRDLSGALLTVGIRVGNPQFDNTNYFDVSLGFFGSGDDEESFKNRRIPLELDYETLRRELWLASDACYKQSAELYSKKEASIKNRLRTDTTHDFRLLPALKSYDTTALGNMDFNAAEQACRQISAVFRNYNGIAASSISMEYLPETVLYINSEGREYIKTKQMAGVEIVASTQASDGMPLAQVYTVYAQKPDEFPRTDSLVKAATLLCNTLNQLLNAPKLEEPYSGPILFEQQAAAEAFGQIFAPNLIAQRPPLTERGVQDNDRYAAFQNKIGGRVLPEFLSVQDMPLQPASGNTSLIGNYSIDDEGSAAQNINVVENGYLKSLLSGRIPTKRAKNSNGHSRGGGPMFSVLSLKNGDKKKEAETADLKKRMMKLVKDRELPYGIIIRRVLNQNILYTVLFDQTAGEFPYAQGDGKLTVLEAYRLYPDGREQLIRGSEIAGMSVPAFKDILLTGKKATPYNYLAPSVVSAFFTGGSQFVPCSLITPDLLFEDIELRPLESDFPKPPFLPAPSAER